MAAKVKVKSVKKTLGNKDVQELFQSALGGGDSQLDYSIAWPKFKRVRYHLSRVVKILSWFQKQKWLKTYFPEEQVLIATYVVELGEEFLEGYQRNVPDLDMYLDPIKRRLTEAVMTGADGTMSSAEAKEAEFSMIPVFDDVPDGELEKFTSVYREAVKSDLLNTAVVICKNLTAQKTHLENKEKLNGRFLLGTGLQYAPIPELPAANFKAFYQSSDLTEGDQQTILVFLHKLYHITHDVYEASSAPDINIDEFVEVIMSSLDQVKGQIPRCNEAFDALSRSVHLLRGNFGTYYRDMKNSGNPSIMMENFVMDVANQSHGSSIKIKAQFRHIIAYYRKMAQQQPSNSQTKVLFSELDSNFAELERREKEAGLAQEDEASEDDEVPPEEPDAGSTEQARQKMTEEERAEHRKEVKRRSRKRANARRTASQGIERHVSDVVTAEHLEAIKKGFRPSALCMALSRDDQAVAAADQPEAVAGPEADDRAETAES